MKDKAIASKIELSIKKISKQFESCEQVKEYEASIEQFEQLIKLGVAKKRGNNLLSVADGHLKNISANTAPNNAFNPTHEHVRFLEPDSTKSNAQSWLLNR